LWPTRPPRLPSRKTRSPMRISDMTGSREVAHEGRRYIFISEIEEELTDAW
jgi:hypothetical protein